MDFLAVILMIGKGILALLLVLLVLLFLVLAVVLFASFFYQVEAQKGESITAKGVFRWLFGAVGVTVFYDGTEVSSQVRLFGKTLEEWAEKKKKKKQKKRAKQSGTGKPKKKPVSQKPQAKADPTPKPQAPLAKQKDKIAEKVQKPGQKIIEEIEKPKESTAPKEQPVPSVTKQEPSTHTTKPPQSEPVVPHLRRIPMAKVEEKKEEEKRETSSSKEASTSKEKKPKTDFGAKKTQEEETEAAVLTLPWFLALPWAKKKELVLLLLQYGKRLFRVLRPKQCIIHGTIGTGEPDTTGEILAALAILKGMFLSEIYVKGVFDRAMVEGDILLAGRVRLGSILKETIWLALKPPIRAIIKEIWKGRGEGK